MSIAAVISFSEINTVMMQSASCITRDMPFTLRFWKPKLGDGKIVANTGFATIQFDAGSGINGPIRFPMQPVSKVEKTTVEEFFEMTHTKRNFGEDDFVFIGADKVSHAGLSCFALVNTIDKTASILIIKDGIGRIINVPLDTVHVCVIDGMTRSVVEKAMRTFCNMYEDYTQFTADLKGRFPLTRYEQIEDLIESMPLESIKDYLSAKLILDRTKIL